MNALHVFLLMGINMITKLCMPILSTLVVSLVGCASFNSFATTAGTATPVPTYQVGDRWTYRAQDGFFAKQQWMETHEVMAVDQSGITVRITQKGDGIDNVRMEEWSAPGQVRVGALYDRETRRFDVPLQRFKFPLASGDKWNQWVRNSNVYRKRTALSIAMCASAVGRKLRRQPARSVPSKLRVVMHLDDAEFWRWPTTCTYSVWYAPAVRNVVREERDADYLERSGDSADSVRVQHALLQLSEYATGSR